MPKVTYTGPGGLRHGNNPSGTEHVFQSGIPSEVSLEDAKHYAEEATREGPWIVDLGLKGTAKVILEAVEELAAPTNKEEKRKSLKEAAKKGRR